MLALSYLALVVSVICFIRMEHWQGKDPVKFGYRYVDGIVFAILSMWFSNPLF